MTAVDFVRSLIRHWSCWWKILTNFQGMDYLDARLHMIMESPLVTFLVGLCMEQKYFNTWLVLTVPSIYLVLKSLSIPVSYENLTWKSSQIIASSLCFPLLTMWIVRCTAQWENFPFWPSLAAIPDGTVGWKEFLGDTSVLCRDICNPGSDVFFLSQNRESPM